MIFHFRVDIWKSGRHASNDTGMNQFIKVVVHTSIDYKLLLYVPLLKF